MVVNLLSKVSGQRLKPTEDMRYAMQSNLAMSVASAALRNLALELIRISNDLRLLSSGPNTGLAESPLTRRLRYRFVSDLSPQAGRG